MLPVSSIQLEALSSNSEKQKGCNWGRIFTKIAATAKEVAKVAVVFGAFFAPSFALPLYMNPGQLLTRKGTSSCGLKETVFTPQECSDTIASHLFVLYDPQYPGHFTKKELETRHEKGITRIGGSGYDKTSFRYLIPIKRLERYERAVDYARWAFVRELWHGKTEKTVEELFQLHSIIKTNASEPTEYRKMPKIVNSYFHTDDFSVYDIPLSDSERSIIAQSDPTKLFSQNSEEAAAWNKMLYLSMTMPDELPEKMTKFVRELHIRMQNGGDYIDHASFFHTEFTRLQPFSTAVGRIARLMVNIILESGELPQVVFKDHREYIQAVREGTRDRAIFTEYLRKSIAWTEEKLSYLDDPKARRIVDEARVMHPGLMLTNVGRQLGKKKMQQEMYLNYQHAIRYLQQTNIMTLSSDELLKLLHSLHILIEQNLDQDIPYTLGVYRSTYMVIDGGDPRLGIVKAQSKLPAHKFKIFLDSIVKVQHDVSYLGAFSDEEKAIWAEVWHLPPAPNAIQSEMDTFIDQFAARRDDNEDPIELAAFTHMEIARIWPYGNANGRLARMMMNEVLRQKGMEFITFPKRDVYYEMVSQAIKDYSVFSRYLRSIL